MRNHIINVCVYRLCMQIRKLNHKNCTVTVGVPFNLSRKRMCPIYERLRDYFLEHGWKEIQYTAENVHNGGHAYIKYEGLIKPEGEDEEILYMVEVTIRGTETTCKAHLTVDSFKLPNRLITIRHPSEETMLQTLIDIIGDWVEEEEL